MKFQTRRARRSAIHLRGGLAIRSWSQRLGGLPGSWGEGTGEVVFRGDGVSVQEDEGVLEAVGVLVAQQ